MVTNLKWLACTHRCTCTQRGLHAANSTHLPQPPLFLLRVPKVSLHCVTAVGQLGQQINPFTYNSYLIFTRSTPNFQDCYVFYINLCQTNCFESTCTYNGSLSLRIQLGHFCKIKTYGFKDLSIKNCFQSAFPTLSLRAL